MTGAQGFDALLNAVVLAITVLIACAAHLVPPRGHNHAADKNSRPSISSAELGKQCFAFSTSSVRRSPVSMSAAEDNLGVKPVVASTVLPLGATINMDGTALYVGIVSVFAAQAFGIDLTLTDYLIMAGTTTLVSVERPLCRVRLCS